jgi:hypothetical protein
MQQRVKRKEIVIDKECTDKEIEMVNTGGVDMKRVERKEIVNDQECTDEEIAMVSTGESDMQRVKRKEMVNDKKYICTKGQERYWE